MILRQVNWQSQERVDVPLLRAVESGGTGDFDMLAGRAIAANHPLVIRGFTINTTGVVGSAANALQLTTADGIICNLLASESGSMLWIPTNRPVEILNAVTNSNVVGSFTANAANNVGLDLIRSADASTADLEKFLDPNTLIETSEIVPTARTLNYRIVITTQPFASLPNLVPIATVVTTAQNNVASIVDCRNILWRLASGGDFPNTTNSWPFLSPRVEGAASSFTGPDKNFQGLKDWADGIMTRIWESGGGEAWFSGTADRNVMMIGFGTPIAAGDFFSWSGTDLTWQGIRFVFDNSTGDYNTLQDQTVASPGLTDLADGDCIYVDLVRQTNAAVVVAHKAALTTVGQGNPPGSRQVIAVRQGSNVFAKGNRAPVGTLVPVATTTSDGIVRLFNTPGAPSHPVVLNLDPNNSIAWTASGGNATALAIIGNGTGKGITAAGGLNNAVSGGPTPGVSPITGPASNGAIFLGGTGTQGGDAVQGFALATGSTKSGGLFYGNWPTTSGVTGGFGSYNLGGTASAAASGGTGVNGIGGDGVGNTFNGGPGANFVGGNGTSSANGGVGVVGTGGTSATTGLTQTIGMIANGGAHGGDGLKGFGVNGIGAQRVGVVGTGGNAVAANDPGGGGLLGFGASATGGNADGGYGVRGTGGGGFGAGNTGLGGWFSGGAAASGSTPRVAVLIDNGYLSFAGTVNPNTNIGFANTLTPKNIPKAWVSCHTDGAGNMIIDEAFNVTSVTISSGTRFVVNFATGMSSTNYCVQVTNSNAAGEVTCCSFKATNNCTIDIPAEVTVTGSPITWITPPSGGFILTQANKFYNVVVFAAQ